jgi:hypothetical protein
MTQTDGETSGHKRKGKNNYDDDEPHRDLDFDLEDESDEEEVEETTLRDRPLFALLFL